MEQIQFNSEVYLSLTQTLSAVNYFRKKAPSQRIDGVLNTPLELLNRAHASTPSKRISPSL